MSIGFTKTFNLERDNLYKCLLALETNRKIGREKIMAATGVGYSKAEAIISWLIKTNVIGAFGRQITSLGDIILNGDKAFELEGTMWLLHYQLSSNAEAEVWYNLTNEFIPGRGEFTKKQAVKFLVEQKGLRNLNDKQLNSDITIFFNAFTRDESLKAINFIREDSETKGLYRKGKPYGLHPLLIAYVMYSQREKHYPEATMIGIDKLLNEDGNVGKVFSLREDDLLEMIRKLHFDKIVDYSSTADLNHIWFTFGGNPLDLLRRYYEETV